jgi:hypothetical protein
MCKVKDTNKSSFDSKNELGKQRVISHITSHLVDEFHCPSCARVNLHCASVSVLMLSSTVSIFDGTYQFEQHRIVLKIWSHRE